MKVDPGNGVNFLIMRTFHVLIVVLLLGACARRQPVPETVRPVKVTTAAGAAVIDKDLASCLLAKNLKADLFIISTGVDKVAIDFKKPTQRLLDKLTVAEAKKYLAEGQFPAGSMGPKIEAAIDFLEHGGKEVIITQPFLLEEAIAGRNGTHLVP